MVRLIATLLAVSALACRHAAAQVPSLPYTFTAAPVSNQSTGIPSFQTTVQLLNPGIIGASYLTVDQATGLPYGSNGTLLLIDIEGMAVQSVRPNIQVKRGSEGTRSFAHGALARVWAADYRYFWPRNPSGVCKPATLTISPAVAIPSGQEFLCVGDGTWGGAGFSWNQAQFSWLNATLDGVWIQQSIEQGDWAIAAIAWGNSSFAWKDIATGPAPQIINQLP